MVVDEPVWTPELWEKIAAIICAPRKFRPIKELYEMWGMKYPPDCTENG